MMMNFGDVGRMLFERQEFSGRCITRYLEVKSMSVAFENDVEFVLKEAKLNYEKHFRVDPFICDFILTLDRRRFAIDCKYNVNRDCNRT